MRVAIQGEIGSYSECAALDFFRGQDIEIVPCADYSDVFAAVSTGAADAMAIPIENSTAGSVYPYYDLLLDYAMREGFHVTRELILRIRHNLLGCPGAELDEVKVVRSHFQAIDQCRGNIRALGLAVRAVYDTAGAAKEILAANERSAAAIASVQAAKDLGMRILRPNLQDRDDNHTRFLQVERPGPAAPREPGQPVKSTVMFCLPNVDGALYRALSAFGERPGVGVIRIESRPLTGTASGWQRFRRQREDDFSGIWDLIYYLDFEAPQAELPGVLADLAGHVLTRDGMKALQSLGHYARGPLRDLTAEPWR